MAFYQCWNLLKFFFLESGETINADALKELLFLEDTTGRLFKKAKNGVTSNEQKNPVLNYLLFGNESVAKKLDEMSPEVINTHLRKIMVEIRRVLKCIEDGEYLDPAQGAHLEYICYVVRMTLLQDKWFDNREKTKPRGCYVGLLYVVFTLEMAYRLWGRKSLILDEGTDENPSGPIWCTRANFVGDQWFPIPDYQEPIKQWKPNYVWNAMNLLMRSRSLGATNLTTMAAVSNFMQYRNALLDRVTELLLLAVPGDPTHIAMDRGRQWYRLRMGANLEAIDVYQSDGGVKALSLELKEQQQKEAQRKRKELMLDSNVLLGKIEPKEVRWAKMKAEEQEKNLRNREAMLFSKESRYQALVAEEAELAPGESMEAADREYMTSLVLDIEDLKKEIQAMKDQINRQAQIDGSRKLIEAERLAKSNKKKMLYDSDARLSFVRQVMIYYDHIKCWQFPMGDRWRIHSKKHVAIRNKIRECIVDSLQMTSEAGFLSQTQEWIVSRDINFVDRELFRHNYSDDYQFTLLDAWSHRRKDDTEFPRHNDRNKKQEPFSDFPGDITELLTKPDNFYYNQAWDYFVWWWVVQKLPGIPVDASAYFWDYEEGYLSLQRVPHENPVMTRIGREWFCARKGKWETEDFKLNGYFCGESHLDCVACWLVLMAENNYDLLDRNAGQVVTLKHNTLKYLLETCMEDIHQTDPDEE